MRVILRSHATKNPPLKMGILRLATLPQDDTLNFMTLRKFPGSFLSICCFAKSIYGFAIRYFCLTAKSIGYKSPLARRHIECEAHIDRQRRISKIPTGIYIDGFCKRQNPITLPAPEPGLRWCGRRPRWGPNTGWHRGTHSRSPQPRSPAGFRRT